MKDEERRGRAGGLAPAGSPNSGSGIGFGAPIGFSGTGRGLISVAFRCWMNSYNRSSLIHSRNEAIRWSNSPNLPESATFAFRKVLRSKSIEYQLKRVPRRSASIENMRHLLLLGLGVLSRLLA